MKLAEFKLTFNTNATLTEVQLAKLCDLLDDVVSNLEAYAMQMAAELPFDVTAKLEE